MKNILLFVFLFLLKFSVNAQPGSLDNSFGTGGKVITNLGDCTNDYAQSVALQSDGKIVVAGKSSSNACCPYNYDFALARYNSDGTLDNTFCFGGIDTSDFGGISEDGYSSVAIQNDGKIVVAGYSKNFTGYDFTLVRYDSNGTLDNSFGSGGKVLTDFGSLADIGHSVIIQSDNKIVVAGVCSYPNRDFAIVRYNSDGSLDNTFGTGGKVTTDFGTNDSGYSLALQSDGKIVMAGESNVGTAKDFAIVRYNGNGTLDSTFGSSGKVTTAIGTSNDSGYSLALQSDGKIVVAGSSFNSSSYYDFAIVRYNSNGSLDTTFDYDGKITMDLGNAGDGFSSVVIQTDNKIVAAGGSNNGGNGDFALIRFNNDGSLDSTFGFSGIILTDFGSSYDYGASVAMQSDNKIVVAGYTRISNYDFAIARYNVDVSVGMEEKKEISDERIFPNPSSGIFTINLKNKTAETKICVYDVLGNCVLENISVKNSNQEIDLSSQAKGTYFMKIISEGERDVQKIVLQ